MLSVVIEANNNVEALASTLASLVGGAVEGIVREVIVCDAAGSDQAHRVAEHAGCHYLPEASASEGARQAKSDWLLLLEPGSRVMDGWMEAVMAHVHGDTAAARFTRAKHSQISLFQRLQRGKRPLREGLVITKRQAVALSANGGSAGDIARSVRARRLGAEIFVAPA